MKKITLISGTIIIVSFILSSCGADTQKLEEQATKDSIEAVNNTARILKAKADSLAQKNSADSLNKLNAINEILGKYNSNDHCYTSYADNDEDAGPMMVITVTNKKNQIIVKQVVNDNNNGGPSGHTEASAEMLGIEKNEPGIYKLNMKKLKCHYAYMGNGITYSDGEVAEDKNIKELTPSNNSDFTIIIDFTKKNAITFKSTAIKTECLGAWEFRKHRPTGNAVGRKKIAERYFLKE